MKKQKKIPGAAESSAGDDFHILWTVRKALGFLDLKNNELAAIYVEGPSEEEADLIDENGDQLLSIDLSEYFGGKKFETAKRIVFSQLKYSTRNPNTEWSLAAICKGKKTKYKGSIIDRLATTFKGYVKEFGTEETISKLKLKLVSNRAINSLFAKFIDEFKTQADNNNTLLNLKADESYKTLKAAAGLNDQEMKEFISILDFMDCGSLNRLDYKRHINLLIANLTTEDDQYGKLHTLVWNKMMPESARNRSIVLEDILGTFNCSGIEDLFPAPSSFESFEVIKRQQTDDLAGFIRSHQYVCIHANGGMGKSTLARTIGSYLPEAAASIVFDCYGGGSYTTPSDKRHKHEWAVLQICNEMALACGTPLLLARGDSPERYLRQLKKRIDSCASAIVEQNPQGILLLIIDAADNSITAAMREGNTECFVKDLVQEQFHPAVRLVVTARTHRVNTLNLPHYWKPYTVLPFEKDETEKHLKQFFPNATEQEISEFHGLTKGVPRVQRYTLAGQDKELETLFETLKPLGKDLDEIMAFRIDKAKKQSGEPEQIEKALALLQSLPRPVPINYLSQLLSLDISFLEEMSRDLWHGLVYENEHFSFRDEDFEIYLEKNYPSGNDSAKTIATLFLANADKDEYASVNLGAALINADEHDQLFEIVLKKKFTSLPADQVRNKELFVERTRLAMRYSQKLANHEIGFQKLMVIAAEAAKTDKVLREVLIKNADLTAAYGDVRTLQKIYFQSEQTNWYGPLHFKSAAIYSRTVQSKKLAEKHLQSAESWVDWRAAQPEDEMNSYQLSFDDLSYAAEAYLRLKGPKALINWLRNRWRSRESMIMVIQDMLYRILPLEDDSRIQEWLRDTFIRSDIRLTIATYCMALKKESGINIDQLLTEFIRILKLKKKIPVSFFLDLALFAEYASINKYDTIAFINELFQHRPKALTYSPKFYSRILYDEEQDNMDIYFRLTYLQNLITGDPIVIEDFYPKHLVKKLNSDDKKIKADGEETKKEFERIYKYMMQVYEMRALWILKKIDEPALLLKIGDLGSCLKADWELEHYARLQVEQLCVFLTSKILTLLPGIKVPETFAQKTLDAIGREKYFIKIGTTVASITSRFKITTAFAAKLISEIESKIVESSMSGPSKMENFVALTIIANNIDHKAGKYYFDKIIEAANDIDDSAFAQIRCISQIAKVGITKSNPELAYTFSSFVEYCKERLYEYEDFPWEQAIQGVSYLDNASGFATICRWDHKQFVELQDHMVDIIKINFDNDFIDPDTAACLLCIYPYLTEEYRNLTRSIFLKMNQNGNAANKISFIKAFIRDVKLHKQQFRSQECIQFLISLIQNDTNIPNDIKSGLQEYYNFLVSLSTENENESNSGETSIWQNESSDEPIPVIVGEVDGNSLNKAIAEILIGNNKYSARQRIDKFLSSLIDGVTPGQYVSQLNALIQVDEESVSRESLEKALKERFAAWDYYFEVKEWKKSAFVNVLKIWFHEFIYYNHVYCSDIIRFSEIFGLDNAGISSAVKSILPEQIEVLDGELIYQLMQLVCAVNLSGQNEEMITWMLARWKHPVPQLSDGVWRPALEPPTELVETLGLLTRYMMGSADKQVRWLASHVLLRLASMNRIEILRYVLINQDVQTCTPFQYQPYIYYWMSAKLWVWLTIAKLTEVFPDKLGDLQNDIALKILNRSQPHALITHFMKLAGLNLAEVNANLFSEEELNQIKGLLVSTLPPITEKKAVYNGPESRGSRDSLRFDFDFMDTVPYWFETPGRVFGLSGFEFAKLIDDVITEKWNYTGDVHKDDHLRSRGENWRSKDHGDVPRVEDLQTYFEFHGMFYISEQLLSTHRMIKDGNWRRNYKEWVEGYALAWTTQWLSELRDPMPIDKKYWTHNIEKENWLETVEVGSFEKWIGIDKLSNPDFFVIRANHARYFGEDHEDIYIESALVNKKTANALLNAFQTAKNFRDYSIPDENDSDRVQVNNGIFKMLGWITSVSNENRGIDSDDPFANSWQKYAYSLGKDFCRYHGLQMTTDFKEYRKIGTNELCGKFESWSNVGNRRSHSEYESQGKTVSVSVPLLLSYLKHKKCSLILECHISKWKSGGRSGSSKNRDSNKLFLIQEDGTIKSFSGNNTIG